MPKKVFFKCVKKFFQKLYSVKLRKEKRIKKRAVLECLFCVYSILIAFIPFLFVFIPFLAVFIRLCYEFIEFLDEFIEFFDVFIQFLPVFISAKQKMPLPDLINKVWQH